MSDPYYMPVLPSFKDFEGKLKSGTKGAGKAAGEQVAKELESAVSTAEKAVTKAGDAAEKAQNKVADATGKVRVAQEQYNKALESGDPVKVAQAEERLESARRRQTEATTAAERADKTLTDAQNNLASAQDKSAKAAREQSDAIGQSRLSAEEAAQASKDLDGAQRVLEVGLLAVGAAAVASAGYLLKLGSDFQEMTKTIRAGTGATGEGLEELRSSALNVGRDVPASFGDVGSALADINTALGHTGQPLEDLTAQFLNLENITGITADTSIPAVTRAFGDWNIAAEDQGALMDRLFRASQATGSGVDQLAQRIVQFGAPMRGMGFDIDETTALLGLFEKTGVNTELVMGSMRQALSKFAREGKSAPEALREITAEIQGMEDPTAAASRAMEVFGARAGADMADSIRGGKFEIDELVNSMLTGTDTINGVADETRSLSDMMAIFKNNVLAELEPMATAAFGALLTGGEWIVDNVVPALQDLIGWISENKSLVIGLTIVIGSMVAGLAIARAGVVAYTIAQRAKNVAVLLGTKGMKGLNLAMRANIFGLIAGAVIGLVAGLTWFFKSTETGQRIWESFMGVLGKAKDFFGDIIDFGKMVADVLFGGDFSGAPFGLEEDSGLVNFLFTLREVAISAWQGIQTAISVAWSLIEPVFDALKVGLQAVGAFFGWVWTALIQPAWNALGAGIAWVWNAIIRPTWDLLKAALGLVGAAFQFYWNNVIKPTWDALGAGIQWVWANVISPTWDMLKAALGAVGDFFSWVWNSIIKPAWDALGAGIRWVADNVVHPVFDGLKRGLELIENAFSKAVDFIGITWDKIKAITAAPINFVIREVYMGGLRPAWEKVANLVGLDPLPEIKEIGGYAEGTSRVPGVRTRHDNVQMVSTDGRFTMGLRGGEGVAVPEVVDAVGEHNWNALNEAGLHGGAPAVNKVLGQMGLGGHASGGSIDLGGFNAGGVTNLAGALSAIQRSHAAFVGRFFPGLFNLTSASRSEPGSMHDFASQSATDWQAKDGQFATQMPTPASKGLARAIATNFPNTTQLIHHPLDGWTNILNGGPFDYGPATNAGHGNHVHWGTRSPLQFDGDDIVLTDIPGGAGGGISMASLAKTAWDKALDLIPSFPGKDTSGMFGDVPGGFLTKSATALWDFVKDKFTSLFSGSSGGGAEQWRDLAEVALRRHGFDPAPYIDAMVKQIEIESGGVPDAVNNWDSNALRGTPSAGLLQVIEPTYRDVRNRYPAAFEGLPDNRTEPLTNLVAGVGALRRDWGGPAGGRWPTKDGYDNGGYLPPTPGGFGTYFNHTGKPEPVFTNSQWTLIKSLIISTAELLDPMRRLARDGRDMAHHLEEMADQSRRQVQAGLDAAGLAVWEALPGEVQDAITAANTAGQMWGEISNRIADKALAWSKGEWPIGSARTPVVEPGPGWQQFHLDDSLQDVARANLDLAEAVITGDLSAGSDPVANALYDIFGRDPIIPDLARIASGGSNAIIAATEAAWVAFETGETARLEEWTASNSQLTEAVLRARDAAIMTGEMVQGAVNGYLNWAMASDSQGRQGSWQEYFQHYGGEYGTAQGDWLLGQVGLGGILGGKFKDSFANLLIETAESPLLSAPAILDDDGRVIGTQLQSEQTATADPLAATDALTADLATTAQTQLDTTDEVAAADGGKTVVLEVEGTHISLEELEKAMAKLGGELDGVKIEVKGLKNQTADVTSGVSLMV